MLLVTDRSMSPEDAALLNPLQLAYIGDAVWEILVRQELVLRRFNVHHMHNECIQHVNAGAQARAMVMIRELLSEAEEDIARRGRNAHARHPAPKNQAPADYADATAFEAVIGYLYLTDQPGRLRELTERVFTGEPLPGGSDA